MAAFKKRLESVMRDGNLRVADLARWFERPHSTVTSWITGGYEPAGGPHDVKLVDRQLRSLERLVAGGKVMPVPRLSPRARIEYLEEVRRGAL